MKEFSRKQKVEIMIDCEWMVARFVSYEEKEDVYIAMYNGEAFSIYDEQEIRKHQLICDKAREIIKRKVKSSSHNCTKLIGFDYADTNKMYMELNRVLYSCKESGCSYSIDDDVFIGNHHQDNYELLDVKTGDITYPELKSGKVYSFNFPEERERQRVKINYIDGNRVYYHWIERRIEGEIERRHNNWLHIANMKNQQVESNDECVVAGCTNEKHQGKFVGDICSACYDHITKGKIGPTKSFLGELKNKADKYDLMAKYYGDLNG